MEAAEKEERTAAEKLFIRSSDLTPKVYTTVRERGVLLTLRYLCEPPSRREAEQAAWEDILNVFAQHEDIEFAYPTQRFYDNLLEGENTP